MADGKIRSIVALHGEKRRAERGVRQMQFSCNTNAGVLIDGSHISKHGNGALLTVQEDRGRGSFERDFDEGDANVEDDYHEAVDENGIEQGTHEEALRRCCLLSPYDRNSM